MGSHHCTCGPFIQYLLVNRAKLSVIQPINRCLKRLQTLGVVSIETAFDSDVISLTEEWNDHPERIDELRSVVRRYVVAV